MTSLFDSAVRSRREHTPWARISLLAFMQEMAWNKPPDANAWEHEIVLKCHLRPAVDTRLWWTLEWTGADGERHSVDSKEFDLLLWRAAEMESRIQEKVEAEHKAEAQKDEAPK